MNKPVDWIKIESAFRAGVLTLRTIGNEHGITEGAIRKRAKKEGWERDLNKKIRARAESIVRREVVMTEAQKTARKKAQKAVQDLETEEINVNARMQADIILSHRKEIRRARGVVADMLTELDLTNHGRELLEQLADLVTADDQSNRRYEAIMRALSLNNRAGTLQKLADSLKSLVNMEREAFGLDAKDPIKRPLEELSDDEVEAQLRDILARMHV